MGLLQLLANKGNSSSR